MPEVQPAGAAAAFTEVKDVAADALPWFAESFAELAADVPAIAPSRITTPAIMANIRLTIPP
ncbi:hypothetical protein ACWGI9_10350 [Streptomyces sp. NPDC054833]